MKARHFCLLFSTLCMSALAQHSIHSSTIAGGGGTSTNGQYAASGTIGQHDAGGPMTNGTYSLTGGFWALPVVVQTPGSPLLSVEQITGGNVRVFWPLPAQGFVLDQGLTVTGAWTQVAMPYTTNATHISVIAPAAGNKFYRLRHP